MPGTNPAVDKYQTVSSVGTQDIDLSTLANGVLVPADQDSVFFTVVAIDTANNPSVPTGNDTTMVTWDKSAPGTPTGLVLTDDTGSDEMHVVWDDQTGDLDLKSFDFYVNFNAPATPDDNTYYQQLSKSFTGGTMSTGTGSDLEGVQDGYEVYVSIYAVDKYGNKSLATETHTTYSSSN
ncbi:hypothetical protein [Brevibacillus centrosporus]|jgi:hypothetical protein|uniref:hypothetical protein n=1 Tax=Brevibacillus centrosporus TaxID=54910 RepID=UPI003802E18E